MKTVREMIYGEVIAAVVFTTLAFLALFSFLDFVSELRWINNAGPDGYQLRHALAYVATLSVSSLYDLLPITVLIGSVFVMARMAQNSEFTVLRTSGLDPWRALKTMLGLGLLFTLVTFAIGDFLVPVADRAGQFLRAKYVREITVGQTGAWLREKQDKNSFWVNVGFLQADGGMRRIRIIEYSEDGKLVANSESASGTFTGGEFWQLKDVRRTVFSIGADGHPHLDANDQASQRYEIELWRKVFYPLSCMVMLVLALPFAYLHFRTAGISTFVFIGVMTGISFFLLNNLFSHFGNLRNWWPWLAAAAPGIIYSILSLSAFSWLVLRR